MKVRLVGLLLGLCAAVCAPVAQAYSQLFVFGDSLSDNGNNALAIGVDASQVVTGNGYVPTFPYAAGSYTNAAVWTQSFAATFGLAPLLPSLAGGTNFAFGGAQTGSATGFPPGLTDQTASFLSGTAGMAPADALYVVAGGGNNARAAINAIGGGADAPTTIFATAQSFASDVGGIVDSLQAAGAQHIIVWNTPDIGLTPALRLFGPEIAAVGTLIAQSMNQALSLRLAGEAGVKTFDLFGLLGSASADPAAFGFANTTDACGAVAGCDPSTYVFWDGIHPTSAGHALIAQGMVAVAIPEPSSYALLLAGGFLMIAFMRKRAG